MSKKRILVISQCFYPEQFRINDICLDWIERGYEVTVVTGIPNYPQGKFYKGYGFFKKRKENYKGINIIRLPIIARGHTPLRLILNYISFVFSGYFWKIFTRQKADGVFIYASSPLTQALVGVWFAKKHKIPCFLYVLDLWPDTVEYITNIKSKFIMNPLGKVCDYIYKNSDKILTASESCLSAIRDRGMPKEKLVFWPQYAEEIFKPMDKAQISVPEILNDGRFNIIFAGNIGQAQGLHILPVAAKILKERRVPVCFYIVGDGRYKDNLISVIKGNRVEDYFRLIDRQPVEKIPELICACDAALICLAPSRVFAMTIPGKVQSCMASGKAIVGSIDGEVQSMINNTKAGVCASAGDANMLADKIADLVAMPAEQLAQMGENAYRYFLENFERQKLLNQMDDWLSSE